MARTELPNGVILPAEYSDDWYEDMTSNLTKLDDVIGSDSEKLNADGVYFLRMSSAALTNGGTGNFSDLNSSYKIKTGDLILDSGRKLYKIVSVDSTNETFTVGNSLFKVTAESDLALVAESGDYDDLTDLPTYGIIRFCSSAITDNSSIAFSAISSTDKIKVGDFLLDTAGKMYQISSVDTANETVSVTTPLTQLAVDANVMHLSGNETKSGELTASKFISNYIQSETGNIQIQSVGTNRSVAVYNGASAADGGGFWAYGKDSVNGSDCRMQIYNTTKSRYECVDLVNSQLLPTPSGELDCGGTSNKWKSINGINPGALSFPDLSSGLDISGYITSGNSHNEYTPTVDGWISVILKGTTTGAIGVYIYQGDMGNGFYGNTGLYNENVPCVMASIPVKAGAVVNIDTKGNVGYVYSAKFYPNLGNV